MRSLERIIFDNEQATRKATTSVVLEFSSTEEKSAFLRWLSANAPKSIKDSVKK